MATRAIEQRTAAWPRPNERRRAESLLGPGHPLVAVQCACDATTSAIVAVAAIQFAALALWWLHASLPQELAIAAGAVELALGLRWAVLTAQRRELCLELVIAGRGRLPLTAITGEVRRLREPLTQSHLAASLDELAAERHRRERQRPMCARRVLTAVQPQLRELADRLRTGGVDVRGVAVIERLITCGTSPLYGDDVAPLRDELARARYLLASRP